jgi:hypothetical protein
MATKPRNDLVRRAAKAPPTVAQAELARLLELRQLDAERNRLRNSVLARLDAGAEVEPGELDAKVSYFEPHSVTWRQLEEVLDEGVVREIRKALGHRQHRRLDVR